jgi:hypothetical protein
MAKLNITEIQFCAYVGIKSKEATYKRLEVIMTKEEKLREQEENLQKQLNYYSFWLWEYIRRNEEYRELYRELDCKKKEDAVKDNKLVFISLDKQGFLNAQHNPPKKITYSKAVMELMKEFKNKFLIEPYNYYYDGKNKKFPTPDEIIENIDEYDNFIFTGKRPHFFPKDGNSVTILGPVLVPDYTIQVVIDLNKDITLILQEIKYLYYKNIYTSVSSKMNNKKEYESSEKELQRYILKELVKKPTWQSNLIRAYGLWLYDYLIINPGVSVNKAIRELLNRHPNKSYAAEIKNIPRPIVKSYKNAIECVEKREIIPLE